MHACIGRTDGRTDATSNGDEAGYVTVVYRLVYIYIKRITYVEIKN